LSLQKNFQNLGAKWPDLSAYERFERLVALVLTILVSIVTILATVRLAANVFIFFIIKEDFLDYEVFQTVFGMIMVVLVALEFNRSIAGMLAGHSPLLQAQTFILIGILALVRKFVILDVTKTTPETVIALSAAVLALGGVYRVVSKGVQTKET